jgi:hypothetical protein
MKLNIGKVYGFAVFRQTVCGFAPGKAESQELRIFRTANCLFRLKKAEET